MVDWRTHIHCDFSSFNSLYDIYNTVHNRDKINIQKFEYTPTNSCFVRLGNAHHSIYIVIYVYLFRSSYWGRHLKFLILSHLMYSSNQKISFSQQDRQFGRSFTSVLCQRQYFIWYNLVYVSYLRKKVEVSRETITFSTTTTCTQSNHID